MIDFGVVVYAILVEVLFTVLVAFNFIGAIVYGLLTVGLLGAVTVYFIVDLNNAYNKASGCV